MTARIPFPFDHSAPNQLNWVPRDGDFYTEENGMRWQWSSVKHRWSFKPPPAISSAYQTVSSADGPPTDETLPWYNPDDGTWSIFTPQGDEPGVWVVSSGAGTDGEDGADLTEAIDPDDITTQEHTFVTANIGKYLCFTYEGEKDAFIPLTSATFAPEVGSLLTIRNDSELGDITVAPAVGEVTSVIKAFTGATTIVPNTTGQYLYRGDNVWHCQ